MLGRMTGLAAGLLMGLAIALPTCAGAASSPSPRPMAHDWQRAPSRLGSYAGPLSYICATAADWPCTQPSGVTGQVSAWYDPWGNPLAEVSPYTDFMAFAEPFGTSKPNSVDPANQLGPESPGTLFTTLGPPFSNPCKVPSWYQGPTDDGAHYDLWHCVGGSWVFAKQLA